MVGQVALVACLTVLVGTACGHTKKKPTPTQKTVTTILKRVGGPAEDSLYACMLDGYAQGLRMPELADQCSTKLLDDEAKGGFGNPIGAVVAGNQTYFDPGKIKAACNTGDPSRGQLPDRATIPVPHYRSGEWGGYSSGGNHHDYFQLTPEQSSERKEKNVKAAEDADAEFRRLETIEENLAEKLKAAKASGDPAAIQKATEAHDAAFKKAAEQAGKTLEAFREARSDPNEKPIWMVPRSLPIQGESQCELALQQAREFLRECYRTQWKTTSCKQLDAKRNNCPDPTLILVDPEQGYTCGAVLDDAAKEALKNAWVARCEETRKYGPDKNPCERPSLDANGHYLHGGNIGNVCNDPHALVDPESSRCAARFYINTKPFGTPDIQEIIVIGLNKIGGPVIVLPSNPRPSPGDPRPGPKP